MKSTEEIPWRRAWITLGGAILVIVAAAVVWRPLQGPRSESEFMFKQLPDEVHPLTSLVAKIPIGMDEAAVEKVIGVPPGDYRSAPVDYSYVGVGRMVEPVGLRKDWFFDWAHVIVWIQDGKVTSTWGGIGHRLLDKSP